MSLKDRRLVLSSSVHSPGTSATVVGKIPNQIEVELHKIENELFLEQQQQQENHNSKIVVNRTSGRIDVSSGLSIACISHTTKGEENGINYFTSINIWEHRTCTLTEELERPDEVSTFVIQDESAPENDEDTSSGLWMITEALVALSPFGSSSPKHNYGQMTMTTRKNIHGTAIRSNAASRQLRSATQRLPSYNLFACTPSGTVYLWNGVLESTSTRDGVGQRDPDTYVILPIGLQFGEAYEDERVTRVVALAPGSGLASTNTTNADSTEDILVSTNRGRMFMVVSQGYPTVLQARELMPQTSDALRSLYFPTTSNSTASANTGGYLTRMFDGVKDAILPSADPYSSARTRSVQASSSGIVDVFCMPVGSSHDKGNKTPQPSSSAVTSFATPLRPSQRARLHRHFPQYRSFLVLRENMELSRWTLISNEANASSSTLYDSPGMKTLNDTSKGNTSLDEVKDLVPDLLYRLSEQWSQLANTSREHIHFKVIRGCLARQRHAPSPCRSSTLIFVVQVSIIEEGTTASSAASHRLYMVQCTSGSSDSLYSTSEGLSTKELKDQNIEIINVQWLSKYPSNAVPNLICKGILASELELEDDSVDYDDTDDLLRYQCMAFSFWEMSRSRSAAAPGISPVSAALVQFGSKDSNTGVGNVKSSIPTTTFDIDLPQDLVPNVLGTGFTSMSEGTLFMSGLTGWVICLKAQPEIHSLSYDGTDTAGALSTMGSLTKSLPMRSLASPSEIRTLTRHLVDAFKQFYSQGTHATDAMVVAGLPPSLKEAKAADLNVATVEASIFLCNETSKSFSGAGGQLGIVREKITQHRTMVTFLSRSGLYRKLTHARQQLMDHGELLQACIAVLEWFQSLLDTTKIKARSKAILNGIENNCTHLLNYLTSLQKDVVAYATEHATELGVSDEMRILSSHVTEAIVASLRAALEYRSRQCEVLYEIPASRYLVDPWTTTEELRTLLQEQCLILKSLGFPRDGQKGEGDRKKHAKCVEVMTDVWLQSYVQNESGNTEQSLVNEYEAAKEMSVLLVKKYISNEAALDLSIDHKYFLGVVQLCEEESGSSLDGNFSSRLLDLINPSSSFGKNVDLHGTTFSQFALQYYADKEKYSTVLELGKFCQSDLSSLLDRDDRLRDYRWINSIRCGRFAESAKELQRMLTDEDVETVSVGSEKFLDRNVLEGLQKLAAKVAAK